MKNAGSFRSDHDGLLLHQHALPGFLDGETCGQALGAAHGGRMYRENLRGQLRFVAKHRGPAEAERARRLLLAGVRARAALFPAARRDAYRDAAGWLASSSAAGLLRSGR